MRKGFLNQNSDFKIKKRPISGVIFCASLVFAICLGMKILFNFKKDTSAIDNEGSKFVGGVIFNDDLKKLRKTYNPEPKRSSKSIENNGVADLPARYNSRTADSRLSNVRTKNQGGEGLCWLYAASTTLEYSLLKTNKNGTIAPKLMDYQFVEAKDAYKQNDRQNIYADQYASLVRALDWPEDYRSLGSGGNKIQLEFILSNPLALMDEAKFANIIKENDDNLKNISSPPFNFYDQIHDDPFFFLP